MLISIWKPQKIITNGHWYSMILYRVTIFVVCDLLLLGLSSPMSISDIINLILGNDYSNFWQIYIFDSWILCCKILERWTCIWKWLHWNVMVIMLTNFFITGCTGGCQRQPPVQPMMKNSSTSQYCLLQCGALFLLLIDIEAISHSLCLNWICLICIEWCAYLILKSRNDMQ